MSDGGHKRLSRGLRHIFNDTSDGAIRDPGSVHQPRRRLERAMPTMPGATPAPPRVDRLTPQLPPSVPQSGRRPVFANARAAPTPSAAPGASLNQYRAFPGASARPARTNARPVAQHPGSGPGAPNPNSSANTPGSYNARNPTPRTRLVVNVTESARLALLRNRDWQSKTLREINQLLREAGFTGQLVNPVVDQRPPVRVITQMLYALYCLLDSNTDTVESELWNRLPNYLKNMGYAYADELAMCADNSNTSSAWKYILAAMSWMAGQYKALAQMTRTLDVSEDEDRELARIRQMESRLVAKAFQVRETAQAEDEFQKMRQEVESALTVWDSDLRESLQQARAALLAKQAKIEDISGLDKRWHDIESDFEKVKASEHQCVLLERDCNKLFATEEVIKEEQVTMQRALDRAENDFNHKLELRGMNAEEARKRQNLQAKLSAQVREASVDAYNRGQSCLEAQRKYNSALTAAKTRAVVYNIQVGNERALDLDAVLKDRIDLSANQIMGFRVSEARENLEKRRSKALNSKQGFKEQAKDMESALEELASDIAKAKAGVQALESRMTEETTKVASMEQSLARDRQEAGELVSQQAEQIARDLAYEESQIASLQKLLEEASMTEESLKAEQTEVIASLEARISCDRNALYKAQTRFNAAIAQFSGLAAQMEESAAVDANMVVFPDPKGVPTPSNAGEIVDGMVEQYKRNVAATVSI